jgi:heat shock protein HslJ
MTQEMRGFLRVCAVVVSIAFAIALLSGCGDEGPAVDAFLEIEQPVDGTMLLTSVPIPVSGTGGGLPEGNVVVQALDGDGNVLAEQATTLQGTDVGTGGSGTWSAELDIQAAIPTTGQIVASSPSPKDGEPVASASVEVAFSEVAPLEGRTWRLKDAIDGTEITALFQDGKVSGSAGCNSYSGTYETTPMAYNSTISISELAVTLMMCEEEVMAQEKAYLEGFQSATTYTMAQGVLLIYFPGGTLPYTE